MGALFTALMGAAVTVEQPIDGQTGVWIKQGGITISSAMKMTGAVVSSGMTQYVYSRGIVSNVTVSSGGEQQIRLGGKVISANYDGRFFCSGGGSILSASSFHGPGNSASYISAGGYVENFVFGATDGSFRPLAVVYGVLSGGTGYACGVMNVTRNAASAYNLTLNSEGRGYSGSYGALLNVNEGAYVSGIVKNSKAYISAWHSGTIIEDVVLREGGYGVYLLSQAFASDVTISAATFALGDNTSARGVIMRGGSTTVRSNAHVDDIVISGGTALVSSGGSASGVAVSSGGRLYVMSGGTGSGIDLDFGASGHVSAGGAAESVHARGTGVRAEFTVYGNLVGATVSGGATLYVSSGGTASNVTLVSGVVYLMLRNGTAGDVTISGGTAFVSSGTRLSGVTVERGGRLMVSSGASALAVTSNAGAIVNVYAGGYIEYVTP